MKNQEKITLLGIVVVMAAVVPLADCHGYMLEPPSRQSAWRLGHSVPPNYDDNAWYCGGQSVQWNRNGGKCGVCGDQWDLNPRPYELPDGMYVKGVAPVNKVYRTGQILQAVIRLTAPHTGNFAFRLCKRDGLASPEATEECLNQNILQVDGCRAKYNSRNLMSQFPCTGLYRVNVKLPDGLTCEKCFFQWKYNTEHYSIVAPEEFYACADIVIRDDVPEASPPQFIGYNYCDLDEVPPCQMPNSTTTMRTTPPAPTTPPPPTTTTTTTTTTTKPPTTTTTTTTRPTSTSTTTTTTTTKPPTTTTTTTTTKPPTTTTTTTSELQSRCENPDTWCGIVCVHSTFESVCRALARCSGCYEYFMAIRSNK